MKEHRSVRGILLDFDVHMNLTLEDAEDISESKSKKLGNILVRGDNIFVIFMSEDKYDNVKNKYCKENIQLILKQII
jgi:small nuclear ribonucleoprotein